MDAIKRSLGISPAHRSAAASHVFHGDVRPAKDDDTPPRAEVINLTDSSDVKNKLMSVWHSMKYGKAIWSLDAKVNLAGNSSSVWVLGQCYHKRLLSSRSNGMALLQERGEEREVKMNL
jgi:hypothetical protein